MGRIDTEAPRGPVPVGSNRQKQSGPVLGAPGPRGFRQPSDGSMPTDTPPGLKRTARTDTRLDEPATDADPAADRADHAAAPMPTAALPRPGDPCPVCGTPVEGMTTSGPGEQST